ncbi:MAG TPA: AAA family ATPase [Tepidisphaeraceae bacterium]|nr:AAA family ATPase [Tepidisphaeraceae bacterium]
MKIQYLWVEEFKNLVRFEVDFTRTTNESCTVILGRNGLGKSNLLEALVVIFRDLYLGKASSFAYKIRYTIRSSSVTVNIQNRPKTEKIGSHFVFEVTEQGKRSFRCPLYDFKSKTERAIAPAWDYLPRHVFAYYSGPSDRLEEHFRPHQRKFYKELLNGKDSPFRPLFYARPIHSNFVLLAFYTKPDEAVQKFLHDRLRIESLETVLFVLRKPHWADRREDGDPRFWRAIGTVQKFLSKLWDVTLTPMRVSGGIPDMFGRNKKTQFMYFRLDSLGALRKLASQSTSAVDFFKELESTYMSDLIHETRIRVKVREVDGSLTFRELSEGEQQLLTVVGLLRFTKQEESLFLLDEPDTHLNPAWGMEYLSILNSIADTGGDSQIMIATHDPLMLAGLVKEQVIVLERDSTDAVRILARHPEVDPRGLGISGILKSSMFGLSTTLDAPTQAKLDERFRLAAKTELDDEERVKLIELSEELSNAGFAYEFSDDNYHRYARAVAQLRQESKPVLTRDEIIDLDAKALAAVRKVMDEGTK